jgi:lipopolysaccharide biosynthesis glycosyltransferase
MRDIDPIINYKTRMPIAAYVEDDFQEHCLEIYGNQDMIYFSDGVFIADLDFWRENNFEEQLIAYAKTHNTRFVDQDAVNFVMKDYIEPLPVTFNFFVDKGPLYYSVKDPLIVHFSGPQKPWKDDMGDNKYFLAWKQKFESLTSQNK